MTFNFKKLVYSVFFLSAFALLLLNFQWIHDTLFYDLDEKYSLIAKRILQSMVWISLAMLISQVLKFLFWRRYQGESDKQQTPRLLRDILIILVYIIVITVIIGFVFKKPLTGFWATSSITAIIIGFALRNIILDIFSGIALQVEQPYVVGDWIEIDQRFSDISLVGKVQDINWRSTYVLTEESKIIIIPNSLITTQAVISNYHKEGSSVRFEVRFTLDYSVSVDRAKRVLLAGAFEATKNKGFVTEKEPVVLIDETTDLGVVYTVRYWIQPWRDLSPTTSKSIIQSAILDHLSSAGLTLAYPKEDIYYSPMPSRQLDPENESDRIQLLSKLDLFAQLNEEEISDISRGLVKHRFQADTVIVSLNEPGDSMFVLMEGLVDVFIENEKKIKAKVATLSPGNYFGEMSLLTGENRSATITAVTDVFVVEITRNHFDKIIRTRKGIIEKISEVIAARKDINEKILSELPQSKAGTNEDVKLGLIRSIKAVFNIK